MVSKTSFGFVALSLLASSQQVLGRIRWLERDDKAIFLHPRRFGQENPAVIQKLSAACPGQVCGNLAGAAITPLLAAQGECTQQDMADQIIDAAAQFDAATQANMIALAVEYRQVEKNTPPDFTTNPPTARNSVFCQKAPKNAQLNGLVQAQDPANGPDIFFDPATKASVTLGSQANTFPFGTNGAVASGAGDTASAVASSAAATESAVASSAVASETAAASDVASAAPSATEVLALEPCTTVVTVTVTGAAEATATASDAVTVSVGASATASSTAAAASSTATDIGNFGSCSVPQIEFAAGFDGRKETSFEPVDKTSFNHGSAQAIGIIAQFICDTLTNSCGADATAKATCATAQAAVNNAPAKTGGQADAFNAAFGITTSFADVPSVDDQGNFVPGTGSADAITGATSDFGSCSTPQIEFGVGFDNRKETSFEPVDKGTTEPSFNHGSAQAIGIIAQFICDTLTNSCGANAAAKATCATAQAAVTGAAAKTGGQADLFNAAFGITTDFAAVASVDDQGNVIAGRAQDVSTGSDATTGATTGATGGIGDFGSCSVPQIEFAAGFDNRKETSFQPVDLQSYNHGSAQAIGIIAQFICDTLVNSCGADATAKATCATAETAVNNAAAKTGGQADAFNAVFGITTTFADVTAIDDQGNPVAGTGSGAAAGASTTAAGAATTVAASATPATSSAAAPAATTAATSTGGNLQTFTGALGSVVPPAVTDIGGGSFQVAGNASFKNLQNALVRSCDVQHNQCANAANASGNKGDLTVAACGDQQTQCNSLAQQ
ncbi:hypothetical protein BDZ89DRAFT_1037735 [Hymenopellis radicata]|nr:hypothetical protein BDZ89DRAFT_1037735 [Hymenopellis radicata]